MSRGPLVSGSDHSGGWGGALDSSPVGSIFVVLFIETDRRFIIKLTEVIWKLSISFVTTRDSYTITSGHNIYAEGERRRRRRRMM